MFNLSKHYLSKHHNFLFLLFLASVEQESFALLVVFARSHHREVIS